MNNNYSKPSMEFHEFYVADLITASEVQPTVSISVKTTKPITDIVVPDPWDD